MSTPTPQWNGTVRFHGDEYVSTEPEPRLSLEQTEQLFERGPREWQDAVIREIAAEHGLDYAAAREQIGRSFRFAREREQRAEAMALARARGAEYAAGFREIVGGEAS